MDSAFNLKQNWTITIPSLPKGVMGLIRKVTAWLRADESCAFHGLADSWSQQGGRGWAGHASFFCLPHWLPKSLYTCAGCCRKSGALEEKYLLMETWWVEKTGFYPITGFCFTEEKTETKTISPTRSESHSQLEGLALYLSPLESFFDTPLQRKGNWWANSC